MAFRASASVGWGSATGAAVTKPTGTASGDILLMYALNGGGTGQSITWPSGFTEIVKVNANGQTAGAAWKLAGGSEPANYTPAFSGTDYGIAILCAYTGRDTTTPVNVYGTSTPTPSGTGSGPWSIGATGVTTTIDGCDIVVGIALSEASARSIGSVDSVPSGHTAREFINSTGTSWNKGYLEDGNQASQGATGTLTSTSSYDGTPSSFASSAIVVALAPAAGGGSGIVPFNQRQGGGFVDLAGNLRG